VLAPRRLAPEVPGPELGERGDLVEPEREHVGRGGERVRMPLLPRDGRSTLREPGARATSGLRRAGLRERGRALGSSRDGAQPVG
jgi:hypothetical protein